MEITNFPLICWRNGEIVVDGENVVYKGGCETFVIANSNMTLNELKDEIYEAIEVDSTKFELILRMKFPSVRGYKVLSLCNDRGLKALWASVCQSKAASMDLFLEIKPLEPINEIVQPTMNNSNFSSSNKLSETENPNGCVSLGRNNVDEAVLDCNIEGDEVEGNVEEEDELLVGVNDDDDDDDSGLDLVSLSVRNTQFSKVHVVDEELVNSWYRSNEVGHKSGGEFKVGQQFGSKKILGRIVTSYHVQRNQVCRTAESKPYTVTYKCARKPVPCKWHLRATQKSTASETFTIVTYKGPHESSCLVHKPSVDHQNLKREFISSAIKHLVEADSGVKVKKLRAAMTKEFNFTISYAKAWAAKQKVIADLYGDWEESYQYLRRYLEALKEANPGTQVHWVSKPTNRNNIEQFDRVFWAFGPSIRGFSHCRPIITMDGTHLYGKYHGVLLIAMGVDADDQLFPLAFAVVEKENYEIWSWFLACIRELVTQRSGICVISAPHAGIFKSMAELNSLWEEPYAFHRYCIRHHASNIDSMFKDSELKETFTNTAMQHQIRKFDQGMENIGRINMNAKAMLEKIPLSKWSLAHDGGKRYGLKTTNMSECFNGLLKGVRFLPIQGIVGATFSRVNKYFVDRREIVKTRLSNGLKWSEKITTKLEENDQIGAHHEVKCYDRHAGRYGVVTRQGRRERSMANHGHTIDLEKRTCTCNKWQNLHYPCSHVMAVCRSQAIDYDQYVDPLYSCGEYFSSYSATFSPIPDEGYWKPWTGSILIPDPTLKRGDGRPKSKRIRNEMDEVVKGTITCSQCNVEGHNKRTCTSKASSSALNKGSNGSEPTIS